MMNTSMQNILKDLTKVVTRLDALSSKQNKTANDKNNKAMVLSLEAGMCEKEADHADRVARKIEGLLE